MENVNSTATQQTIRQHQQQYQQQQHMEHQQHQHDHSPSTQQQQQQQQQQQYQQDQYPQEHQQFCLRWHNHQTSLLSTLPELLDQSHLTDLTISVEGRILRAHRVVLSACSTYFFELFRMLEPTSHPVIIIPGASFGATVSLLTFMYSGEVNVYEDQIPMLLSLAETLGVKGLADVPNKSSKLHTTSPVNSANDSERKRCGDMDTPISPLGPVSGSPSPQITQSTQLHAHQQRHANPQQMPPTSLHASNLAHASQSAGQLNSTPLSQPPPAQPPPPPPTAAAQQATAPPPQTPSPSSCGTQTGGQTSQTTSSSPLMANKLPTPLESLFLKSLQFYPNLLPQPLNFSQTAFSKTTELLAKYQQQCHLYQGALSGFNETAAAEEASNMYKRLCTGEKKSSVVNATHHYPLGHMQHHHHQQHQQHHQQQQHQKDIKRIDKIVESLRCCSKTANHDIPNSTMPVGGKTPSSCNYDETMSALISAAGAGGNGKDQTQQQQQQSLAIKSEEQKQVVFKLQQQIEQYNANRERNSAAEIAATMQTISNRCTPDRLSVKLEPPEKMTQPSITTPGGPSSSSSSSSVSTMATAATPTTPGTPTATTAASASMLSTSSSVAGAAAVPVAKTPSNSKLYATCFICHKQLSNQYNLRVHLETHQNVRYACNVCSHVSRSKDALRKHVSYRHPGAPSPCETEARRKRASKALNAAQVAAAAAAAASSTSISPPTTPSTPTSLPPTYQLSGSSSGGAGGGGDGSPSSGSSLLDSETQLAAAAAAAQLTSPFMFLPNQFQLAAAAAVAAQQQHHQQQLQSLIDSNNNNNESGALAFPLNLGTHPTSHQHMAMHQSNTNPSPLMDAIAKDSNQPTGGHSEGGGERGGGGDISGSRPVTPLNKSPTPPLISTTNGTVCGASNTNTNTTPTTTNNNNNDNTNTTNTNTTTNTSST